MQPGEVTIRDVKITPDQKWLLLVSIGSTGFGANAETPMDAEEAKKHLDPLLDQCVSSGRFPSRVAALASLLHADKLVIPVRTVTLTLRDRNADTIRRAAERAGEAKAG